ncbi:MAG: hypothetical protein AAGB51_10635 [Planctomycetota bacterium]
MPQDQQPQTETPKAEETIRRLLDRLPVPLPEQLTARATMELSQRLRWLHGVRLRVFGVAVAAGIAGVAAVSFAAAPVIIVTGVAITAVAVAVNTLGGRLSAPVCMSCGESVEGEPAGPHGVICPKCGAISPADTAKNA